MEGSNGLNPHHPLRILSLDGGGVRGLSSLMILQDLMESIAKQEIKLGIRTKENIELPRPCDYFDLIGGTSTGGIIAVLLGRLRLDVRDCIKIYSQLAGQIFNKDRAVKVVGVKILTGQTRFSSVVLERAIKNALVENEYDEDERMWDESLFEEVDEVDPTQSIWIDNHSPSKVPAHYPTSDASHHSSMAIVRKSKHLKVRTKPDNFRNRTGSIISSPSVNTARTSSTSFTSPLSLKKTATRKFHSQSTVHRKKASRGCRTLVVTSLKNALGVPALLSTYDPSARETRIWEALRATSAAPTFFEEIAFGSPKMTYLDGGMGFNNPCSEIVQEVGDIWPGRAIGIVVSIGTGLQTIPSVKKGACWLPFGLGVDVALASALASMSTSTARVHNEMQRAYAGKNTNYYRFDVDSGMADISLEQWMKEDEMSSLTEQYMHDPRQLRRAAHVGELIVKFSALPPKFEISPTQFTLSHLEHGRFKFVDLDFKTGHELGLRISPEEAITRSLSDGPCGKGGLDIDVNDSTKRVFPVAQDLDHDGRKEEATVISCVRAENVCFRVQKEGIPQGKYVVKWIVAFSEIEEGVAAPVDLVFSVGKPWNKACFLTRFVDVRISRDIVAVLLQPDALRIRVGEKLYEEKKGKSWVEIMGDAEVEVGLDGVLAFVVSKRFEQGEYVGGLHFGGVRVVPVSEPSHEERKRYDST